MTRNLPPTTLRSLPRVYPYADYEAAYNARRHELQRQQRQCDEALLPVPVYEATVSTSATPTMSWVDGYRSQPRDGKGRFLPRTWLADAELFLTADRAWFRSSIGAL